MGTKTLRIHINKDEFPSSTEDGLNLIKTMWINYLKEILKTAQSTIDFPYLLSEERLGEICSKNSFECDAFKWNSLVENEPTCITGSLVLSCPKYTPALLGNTWSIPSEFPWFKFSETFSDE